MFHLFVNRNKKIIEPKKILQQQHLQLITYQFDENFFLHYNEQAMFIYY